MSAPVQVQCIRSAHFAGRVINQGDVLNVSPLDAGMLCMAGATEWPAGEDLERVRSALNRSSGNCQFKPLQAPASGRLVHYGAQGQYPFGN